MLFSISERMEFEPRWLLLFHQSAAADRRGDHPLYRAGTTGHRICTTAGNDCVIRPQEHTQPCTDALRDTHAADPVYIYSAQMQFPLSVVMERLICCPYVKNQSAYTFPVFLLIYRSSCLAVC